MRLLIIFVILFAIISCKDREEKTTVQNIGSTKQNYLIKGDSITNLTQTELLKNVSQAIKKGGPGYAVEFCNIKALFLKDSLSQLHNCEIKRLTLKYRNPYDKPQSELENQQLTQYQDNFENGTPLLAEVYFLNDRIEYYKPIMISKEACLKCHGNPLKDITGPTLQKIRARYPDDLATGYAMNDFRGAWKITFRK